jgi:hypothetical protein
VIQYTHSASRTLGAAATPAASVAINSKREVIPSMSDMLSVVMVSLRVVQRSSSPQKLLSFHVLLSLPMWRLCVRAPEFVHVRLY